jgi:hypothetical protein
MCAPGDQRKSSDKQRERAEDQLSIDSNLEAVMRSRRIGGQSFPPIGEKL